MTTRAGALTEAPEAKAVNGVPVTALTMPLTDQFLTIASTRREPFARRGSSATNPSWKMWVRS